MNRPALLGLDGPIGEVDRLAEHIHHPPECRCADGYRNGNPRVLDSHAALHAVGRLHRDGTHAVLSEMLLHFGHDVDLFAHDAQGVIDGREVPFELDVDHRSDDLYYFAG